MKLVKENHRQKSIQNIVSSYSGDRLMLEIAGDFLVGNEPTRFFENPKSIRLPALSILKANNPSDWDLHRIIGYSKYEAVCLEAWATSKTKKQSNKSLAWIIINCIIEPICQEAWEILKISKPNNIDLGYVSRDCKITFIRSEAKYFLNRNQ